MKSLSLKLLACSLFALIGAEMAIAESATACLRPLEGFLEIVDSQPIGLEADLVHGFAEASGLEVEIRLIKDFGELLEAVIEGDCDLAAAAITITDERKQRLDFSDSYFPGRSVLVERSALAAENEAWEDLVGAKVAVIKGTIHEELVQEHAGVDVFYVEDDEAMWEAVVNGQAQALICDAWQTIRFFERYPTLHTVTMLSERTHFGFAFPKGSALRQGFNGFFHEEQKNGGYRASLVRHFGENLTSGLLDEP